MFLIPLTFCVGTVQEIKVVVGCLVSPFLFCLLGILLDIGCSYRHCVLVEVTKANCSVSLCKRRENFKEERSVSGLSEYA